ncbi:colicin uptake protein TolR [Candidatus Profftia sp. (ex Adelges kitamiensis)]|uniref:colicin uptake protein TolR n=1 Tax=Candidatus Profftia sp. (ex Adelges kitamiensis) TaxID=2864218 RepID=UPI001CE35890|nr:colicin uptake protein TolR [Candidatus Profftia sp. (ex Adelges kitamiensis)]
MVQLSSRRVCKYEINIIPLLDVLLVLVLILLISSPIVTQIINIDLPNNKDSKKLLMNNNDLPVIIEVSGIGQYAVVISHKRIEHILADQVIKEVQLQLKINPKKMFLIGGSKDISYNEIIKTLHLLHVAGVTSIGLMTQSI